MVKATQNIILAVRLIVRFLIFGAARKNLGDPKRILVIQLSQLGDMVCTTPLFRAVKLKYPASKLTVMGNAINRELLRHNPDVDEYIVNDPEFSRLVKTLKSMQFDFGCMTSPSFTNLALMYLAGIPLIVAPDVVNGFCPYATRLYTFFKRLVITVPHRMGSYAPREYLRLLEPIGIHTEDTAKHLGFSPEAKSAVDQFFARHAIATGELVVGISPSAGHKIKLWGRDRFAQLADYLHEKHRAKIIILGGKNDATEVAEMMGYLRQTTPVIAATHFTIDELKACVARLSLFISVDTGPIYIAEAFGVPTVDITGPIDEREQPPIGRLHRVVTPRQREKPQLFVMNARGYDLTEARRQADSITVEDVMTVTDDLIAAI